MVRKMTSITIETTDLYEEIEKWDNLVRIDNSLVEVAFFKIFVKFENFLVDMFTTFSTGNTSSFGYLPTRKLNFTSYEHLKKTVTERQFIDFNNRMEDLSKQIFEDNNPFNFFFDSSDMDFFSKMKILRNYIAHESPESKQKYIRKNLDGREYITPSEYLLRTLSRTNHKTNYTQFIEIVQVYSEKVINFEDNN